MKNILSVLIALFMVPAFAWQPTKPVTVIFPNGPGAGNEISFRIVAKIVEEKNPKFKWSRWLSCCYAKLSINFRNSRDLVCRYC